MATSEIKYISQLRTECTHLNSNNKFLTDAPTDNNGKGEAFSPTDTVATALGSCMLTIMGIYTNKHQYDLNGSTVLVTKHMSSEGPRKITKIDLDMTVRTTKSLSDQEKEALKRVAATCPVARSLHPDIEQNVTIKFE